MSEQIDQIVRYLGYDQKPELMARIYGPAATEKPMAIETGLRPAHKLFFHATPATNVATIQAHGLIGNNYHDMIGKDLGYSLTFDKEYNGISRTGMGLPPIQDLSLTVWQNSADIKWVTEDDGELSHWKRGPAGQLDLSDRDLEGYRQGLLAKKGHPDYRAEDRRRISPDHLLAVIPITEASQTVLIQAKLDFFNNVATANEVEQRILAFITDPSSQVTIGPSTTAEEVAHDLTAKIEQEVALHEVKVIAQQALQRISDMPAKSRQLPDRLEKEIAELKAKLAAVNEPVSQRYLAYQATRCQAALVAKGAGKLYDQAQQRPDQDNWDWAYNEGVNYYKLWGTNDGWALARKIRGEV